MNNTEIYIGKNTPVNKESLWLRPLNPGVSLYGNVNGKWEPLKLINGKGTRTVEDDEVIDVAGGYSKEEIDERFADILGLDAEGIAELKALIEDEDSLTGLLSEINNKADKTELENVAYTNVNNRFTGSNRFRYGDSNTSVLINNGGVSVCLASNENQQWCEIEKDNLVFCDTGIGQIAFKPISNNGTVRLAGGANHANYKPLAYLEDINGKQDTLVSGTNIKTVNSTSLLGSGDVSVGTITGITMNGASKGTSGVVDLGTVLTSTTSSVTSGSTTPITSGGVYTALRDYEPKLSFTSSNSTSYTATKNTYYRHTNTLTSLAITLPSTSLSAGAVCGFRFVTSSSFSSFTISGGSYTVIKMKDFSIEASKIYEVIALFDGAVWLVTATEFE